MLTGRGLARGRKWLRAWNFRSSNGRARACKRRPFGGSWKLRRVARATAAAAGEGTAALGLTAGTAQVGAIPVRGTSWELFYLTLPGPTLSHVLNEQR